MSRFLDRSQVKLFLVLLLQSCSSREQECTGWRSGRPVLWCRAVQGCLLGVPPKIISRSTGLAVSIQQASVQAFNGLRGQDMGEEGEHCELGAQGDVDQFWCREAATSWQIRSEWEDFTDTLLMFPALHFSRMRLLLMGLMDWEGIYPLAVWIIS